MGGDGCAWPDPPEQGETGLSAAPISQPGSARDLAAEHSPAQLRHRSRPGYSATAGDLLSPAVVFTPGEETSEPAGEAVSLRKIHRAANSDAIDERTSAVTPQQSRRSSPASQQVEPRPGAVLLADLGELLSQPVMPAADPQAAAEIWNTGR